MKRFLLGILITLLLVFIATTAIFAFLFFRTQTDLNSRNTELSNSLLEIEDLDSDTSGLNEIPSELITFEDVGADIIIEYPSSWNLIVDTDMSEEFAYEPVYGRILEDYDITLDKAGGNIVFDRILGAIDGFGSGLKESSSDIFEVTDSIVRYATKGESDWSYAKLISCSDIEMFLDEPASDYDFCIEPFFSDIANIGATQVTVSSSNADVLLEADSIVISTQ